MHVHTGILYLSTGAGFPPSSVVVVVFFFKGGRTWSLLKWTCGFLNVLPTKSGKSHNWGAASQWFPWEPTCCTIFSGFFGVSNSQTTDLQLNYCTFFFGVLGHLYSNIYNIPIHIIQISIFVSSRVFSSFCEPMGGFLQRTLPKSDEWWLVWSGWCPGNLASSALSATIDERNPAGFPG